MAPISTRRFMEITDTMPRLGRAFVWAIARDGAIITQHLVNLGRRNAIERMAHFLLEIRERLRFIGIEVNGEFKCPLSQEHLADALGLTPVHVNRVLRRLRVMNLVSLSHGELHIHNVQGLEALASYDDAYLDQDE
jgi:CRP-like cAMP-binding protein